MDGRSLRERLDAQMALNAARGEQIKRLEEQLVHVRRELRNVKQELVEERAIRADLEAENTKFRRVLKGVIYA